MTTETAANETLQELAAGAPEQGITPEQAQQALVALSGDELLLLNRNADQFRHYINKKAKRLKREAQQKASITSEGASQP
jgi:hypothetical protein